MCLREDLMFNPLFRLSFQPPILLTRPLHIHGFSDTSLLVCKRTPGVTTNLDASDTTTSSLKSSVTL